MMNQYYLIAAIFIVISSHVRAADLIIRFDEEVSQLSVRLWSKKPSTPKVVSIDDQVDPNPAIYPNISELGKVATFVNVPAGSCWVTIEDSNSSWGADYIDVREIDKTDSSQQINWDIPDGFVDIMFHGEKERVLVKLERRIGGKLDEVFQKWLILEHGKSNMFSGKFVHVGDGVFIASFFEYSADKGIGALICSCSATRADALSKK
jgi:hypothetical protein